MNGTNPMKTIKLTMGLLLAFFFLGGESLQAAGGKELPGFVLQELAHLAETYRILDLAAEKIWPGWTNYRDFPFLFEYQNGLRVLIGHPVPPGEFEKLADVRVENKDVYADFSHLSTRQLAPPLFAGGGPLPFGTTKEGKPVTTVMMNFMSIDILKKGGYGIIKGPYSVELQILCYIHELFHCFQNDHIKRDRVGNLRFNPDSPFAIYSEIEGQALLRAYKARNRQEAEAFIRDFLAARALKRKTGFPEEQQKQESSDELSEGTAVYTSMRTLEILGAGYESKLDLSKDTYYSGFKKAAYFENGYVDQLKASSEEIYDPIGKSYDYGCFQALLLERYYPGWQKIFSTEISSLNKELAKRIPVDEKELPAYEKRFREIYGLDRIQARCSEAIRKRDDAYHSLMSRRGMSYILNIKEVNQYENQLMEGAPLDKLGLINMYMEGTPAVKLDQSEISRISVPVEGNQLYYLKIVDTSWKSGQKPYSISFRAQDGSVYEDAVVTTPLFTLKTSRVRIDESSGRVKFTLLPVMKKD